MGIWRCAFVTSARSRNRNGSFFGKLWSYEFHPRLFEKLTKHNMKHTHAAFDDDAQSGCGYLALCTWNYGKIALTSFSLSQYSGISKRKKNTGGWFPWERRNPTGFALDQSTLSSSFSRCFLCFFPTWTWRKNPST